MKLKALSFKKTQFLGLDRKKMKITPVFASSRQLINLLLFKIQITKGEQKILTTQQEKKYTLKTPN